MKLFIHMLFPIMLCAAACSDENEKASQSELDRQTHPHTNVQAVGSLMETKSPAQSLDVAKQATQTSRKDWRKRATHPGQINPWAGPDWDIWVDNCARDMKRAVCECRRELYEPIEFLTPNHTKGDIERALDEDIDQAEMNAFSDCLRALVQ